MPERLEPVFDRKRANLEAQAPHLTSDTKKTNFSELAVLSENGAVTKTGDIGKTFSWMENSVVLQGFSTKKQK